MFDIGLLVAGKSSHAACCRRKKLCLCCACRAWYTTDDELHEHGERRGCQGVEKLAMMDLRNEE